MDLENEMESLTTLEEKMNNDELSSLDIRRIVCVLIAHVAKLESQIDNLESQLLP
jgi:hypothetical protein